MRNVLISLLLCFFPLLCYSPAYAWDAYVVRVEGGGVIVVSEKRGSDEDTSVIGFYGIDVPSMRQPYGPEALEYLRALLPLDEEINIESVIEDDRGMVRALVQVGGKSVNYQLLMEGLAWVSRSSCKAIFCRRWHIQEHQAIREKRGLWGIDLSSPPWQWTR